LEKQNGSLLITVNYHNEEGGKGDQESKEKVFFRR
jgi:hypothetical protein